MLNDVAQWNCRHQHLGPFQTLVLDLVPVRQVRGRLQQAARVFVVPERSYSKVRSHSRSQHPAILQLLNLDSRVSARLDCQHTRPMLRACPWLGRVVIGADIDNQAR